MKMLQKNNNDQSKFNTVIQSFKKIKSNHRFRPKRHPCDDDNDDHDDDDDDDGLTD